MKIDYNTLDGDEYNIVSVQFWVYVTRNDIIKYNMVDDEIKESKKTILEVFYNINTKEIEYAKIVLDYCSNSKCSKADFSLTKYQHNRILKLIQEGLKTKSIHIYKAKMLNKLN